jgi:DNA-binding transcriptional MerR regulator
MRPRLHTIGRFAQLTGLTVRALRLYDTLGLLRPAHVDGQSGYRYYGSEQFPDARWIALLRQVDMPLEDIRLFLAGGSDRERALASHRERLRGRAADTATSLGRLAQLMEEHTMSVDSFAVKTIPDLHVLAISGRWPQEDLPRIIPPAIGELFAARETQGRAVAGAPYLVCSAPNDEGVVLGEIGLPIDQPGVADGRSAPAVLRGAEVAACYYRGPYHELCTGYRELWAWIEDQRLEPAGNPREIYLTSPAEVPDPANYLTELVWPVRRASGG